MATLRPDRYYDLQCDYCCCNWSTDFDGGREMFSSRDLLLRQAKSAGWAVRKGKNACPECAKKPAKELFREDEE